MTVLNGEDRATRRRAQRAAAARRRYHENIDASRARCRASKQRQARRLADADDFPAWPGRADYDAEDYAEEWVFLTNAGMRSDQIIARSRPSRDWFVRSVMPLVDRSNCSACGRTFNPHDVNLLTRCYIKCAGESSGEV